jgi:hypothetical protein
MIARYRVLGERIQAELASVKRAAGKALEAFEGAQQNSHHATFFLDSVAGNLHGFYNGVERIFASVAGEIDGGLPAGSNWHRELLRQMALDVESLRPAVIGLETARRLEEFLRFRYLVRNLYTWSFAVDKLAGPVNGLPHALTQLERDLAKFGRFLEAASSADEIGF